MDSIDAYTDGSCVMGRGRGSWAFYIEYGDRRYERFGFREETTVNEMELSAILHVLCFTKLTKHPLTIWTDSQYSLRAVTIWIHLWRIQEEQQDAERRLANRELIEEVARLIELHKQVRPFAIKYLSGHVGHLGNERADGLASYARKGRRTNWTGGPNQSKLADPVEVQPVAKS